MKKSDQVQKAIILSNITKTFPGVKALDDVGFEISSGEIRGLVGKNGAGKSTLMKILGGIYQPDKGAIFVNGKAVHTMTTEFARRSGISIVHQHSQLFPALSVAENIFCGSLPRNRLGLVNWKSLFKQAEEKLLKMGLEIDVQRKVEGLSIAERQIIEITKALFSNAKVVVLDEPTASLPRNEIELLFNFIKGQRDMGVGFIYISHFLEEVFELCDSVTILRDGVVVSTESVSGLNLQELIRLISGVKLEHFKRDQMCESDCDLFRLEKINREDMFRDISFTLKEGEIVGITGLEGSGKDVLARSIFGLEKIDSGKMILRDEEYFSENPEEAIGKGISYLPRDRHGLGIVGIRPIRENITLSILKRLLNNLGLIKKSEELKIVNNNVHDLDIAMSSPEQPVEFLSGGNQQKVVFAKLANTQPKVLILEEPTQGVDIQAKTEILKIINNMAKMGVGILFISEEIHELLDICDRILVLYEGEIINEFQMGDVNAIPENILSAIEGEHS